MACTNCRARKIKVSLSYPLLKILLMDVRSFQCESNRQHPERPCQRCTNRKLHCEYVAISHPPQTNPNDSYKLDPSSPISPESPRRSHSRAPSSHLSSSQPRYSPISSSFSRRGSPRNEYDYISPEPSGYLLSQGNYAPDPGSTPRYNASYYPSANYNQAGVFTQTGNNQVPNAAVRGSINSCYADPSLGMNPSLAQGQVNFGSGTEYVAWNNGLSLPAQNQFFYSR